jgi:hypothetical protein
MELLDGEMEPTMDPKMDDSKTRYRNENIARNNDYLLSLGLTST